MGNALVEDAEGVAEVVGVDEGLELALAVWGPGFWGVAVEVGGLDDAGEEGGLGEEGFGLETGGFAGGAEGGEVDVGGEVLGAWGFERVGGYLVVAVAAEGALVAVGGEAFLEFEAVVEGEEVSGAEVAGGLGPPFGGLGGGFEGEGVGEEGAEAVLEGLRQGRGTGPGAESGPEELVIEGGHAPFEPALAGGVPAEAVDWEGIEEFIGEDDAVEVG